MNPDTEDLNNKNIEINNPTDIMQERIILQLEKKKR